MVLFLDYDGVVNTVFGYDNAEHFIKCTTNGGFQLEEFEEAKIKVEQLTVNLS